MRPQFDLIVPFKDQPDVMLRFLASLRVYGEQPFRLIVIDNGSRPQSSEIVEKELPAAARSYRVVKNPNDRGADGALYQGIRLAVKDDPEISCSFLVLAMNNITLTAGWSNLLQGAVFANALIGAAGPSTNGDGPQSRTGRSGLRFPAIEVEDDHDGYAKLCKDLFGGRCYVTSGGLSTFCLALRKTAMEEMLADLSREDLMSSLSKQLSKKGYKQVFCPSCYIPQHKS